MNRTECVAEKRRRDEYEDWRVVSGFLSRQVAMSFAANMDENQIYIKKLLTYMLVRLLDCPLVTLCRFSQDNIASLRSLNA